MERLSVKLDEINGNSDEMDLIANSTKELSSNGLIMVETLIEKSNKTKEATSEVNRIIEDMYESSLQISNISDALTAITAQTNLLSLNASIEAASAGDAGKGFAVVASEIRNLAEQSKNSTEEIKVIIENIQSKASSAAESIKGTSFVVEEQEVAVSEETASASEEVTASTEEINATMEEFARHSENLKNVADQLGVEVGKFVIQR